MKTSMFPPRVLFALAVMTAVACTRPVHAQAVKRCGTVVPYTLSVASRPSAAIPAAPVLFDARVLRVPRRAWLQLEFSRLELDAGALLEIRSLADGATEVLDGRSRGRRFSSFFNGDAVRLRLWTRGGASRYAIRSIGVSTDDAASVATLCGVDDRQPSSDARVARLLLRFQTGYAWCSAFLISPTGDGRAWDCFATSGNCLAVPGVTSMTAQFQVPTSANDGSIRHPPPSAQYAVSSRQSFVAGAAGSDWGLFATLPNATTGLHAGVVQKAGYNFATSPQAPTSIDLVAHGASSSSAVRNGVQQNGAGVVLSASSFVLRHRADTSGGSAGGPILNAQGEVVAIQVEGGCDNTPTSANGATLALLPAFVAARKAFCIERADLVATALSTSKSTLEAGQTIELRSTIRNDGTVPSGPYHFGYYESRDDVVTATDRLLYGALANDLGAGKFVDHRVVIRVPVDVKDGPCWVGVIADDREQATEWNETNNTRVVAVTCRARPNLSVKSFTSTASLLVAGQSYEFSLTVQNDGGAAATPTSMLFVHSVDSVITSADTPLATLPVPALASKAEHEWKGKLPIPLDAPSGDCWIGAILDPTNNLLEASENDNIGALAKRCRGLPDLIAGAVTSDAQELRPDLPFVASVRVDNGGFEAAAASTVRFVISKDSVVSQDDTLLGFESMPSLLANAGLLVRHATTAPKSLVAGPCYVGVEIDPAMLVTEQDRSNNTAVVAVRCSSEPARPDLHPTAFTTSTTQLVAGRRVQLDATVRNDGLLAAAAFRVGFYLSNDSVVTNADTLLDFADVTPLLVRAEARVSKSPLVPKTLASGNCWLGVIADDRAAVTESNEANNTRALAAQCVAQPDLVVHATRASTSIWNARDAVTLTSDTENVGGAASPNVPVAVYLSRDAIVDTRDRLVSTANFLALAAQTKRNLRSSLTIPVDVTNGDCWLGLILDPANVLVEIDETNNVAVTPGKCTAQPDLSCAKLFVVDGRLTAGQSVAVQTISENAGGAQSSATELALVLSATSSVTLRDTLLGIVALPAIDAGGKHDVTTRHVVPWFTSGKSSFVTAFLDAGDLVRESDESNNTLGVIVPVKVASSARRSLEWKSRYRDVQGGVATLSLVRGAGADLALTMPRDAGYFYILLWSGNPSVFVYDGFTDFSIGLLNGPMFASWVGFLDASGRASAAFRLPPVRNFSFDVAVHGLVLRPSLAFDGFADDVVRLEIRH